MIELADVSVTLGETRALRGVSFAVAQGEWVALIGPNGAGKTTALRAICGLVPYSGSITVDGTDARALGRRRLARTVALVPQLPERPPDLTVAEYVLLGRTPHLGYFAAESRQDRTAATRALARLELLPLRDRLLGSLSGGELQRAVLARALAQEADVLLLDEPTSALDLGRQQQALELVHALRSEAGSAGGKAADARPEELAASGGRGLTILSTMHDLTLAGQYADRLVLLDEGVVVADGAAADVLSSENIAAYYGARVRVLADGGRVFVLPVR